MSTRLGTALRRNRGRTVDYCVVFVVPSLLREEATQFAALPALIRNVAEAVPVEVIVDKADSGAAVRTDFGRVRTVHSLDRRGRYTVPQLARLVRAIIGEQGNRERRIIYVRYSRLIATVALLAGYVRPVKVVYWHSTRDDHGADQLSWKERLRRRAVRFHVSTILRRASMVVTGPKSMADFMTARWGIPATRIRVVPNDVDVGLFHPNQDGRPAIRRALNLPECDRQVLFLHRLSARRGAHLLSSIANQLAEIGQARGEVWQTVAVGDGPETSKLLNSTAVERGHLVLAGAVAWSQVHRYYQASDVFVMPSYEEGFPRVVVEAMACGVSISAWDAGGTREVLAEAPACLAAVGDVRGLITNTARLLAMPMNDKETMSRRLRSVAEARYSTERVAQAFVRVFHDIGTG